MSPAICIAFLTFAAPPVYVGIVDDIWANDDWASGPPLLHGRCLTTAFVKDDEHWKDAWSERAFPLPSESKAAAIFTGTASERKSETKLLAAKVAWSISFDGRNIGTFEGPASVAPQCDSNFPTPLKKRAPEYLGSDMGNHNRPAYRPVIATNRQAASDPDQWKPAQLSKAATDALRTAWVEDVLPIPGCAKQAGQLSTIRLLTEHVYVSDKKAWLIFAKPTGKLGCKQSTADVWRAVTYYWPADEKPRRVGTSQYPIDAGDYDGDGKTEWVMFASFSQEDGSIDGYVLYSNDFANSVASLWRYH